MTQADAAELVLSEQRRPLHRREISDEIISRNLPVWGAGGPGKTPWESVGRALTQEIANRGAASRFEYVDGRGSGVFRLRASSSVGNDNDAPRVTNITRVGTMAPAREANSAKCVTEVELLERIGRLGADPDQFIKTAVLKALKDAEVRLLEEQHRRGYERFPVQPDEFVEMDPDAWDEL